MNAPLLVHLSAVSQSFKAVLVDLSATGARIRGAQLPPEGLELYFAAHTVKTVAQVRWRRGRECGLQFYEPLSQMEVVGLRREVAKGVGLAPETRAALDDWVLGLAR